MKILLIGASGYVGGALYAQLSRTHEVVGTYSGRPRPDLVQLDITDDAALRTVAADGYDVVLQVAGLVELADAEKDPGLAAALNTHPAEVLTEALAGAATKFAYVSTDNVFDGTAQEYTEDSPVTPNNAYGWSKAAGERAALADPSNLVVRIPLVYGRSPWADRFVDRFKHPVTPAQTDVVGTPLYLPGLAPALEQLLDRTGILHVAGPDAVSRYELMTRIRDALDLPTEVVPRREADDPTSIRPRRLVLRSVRHDVRTPSVDEAMADLARTR